MPKVYFPKNIITTRAKIFYLLHKNGCMDRKDIKFPGAQNNNISTAISVAMKRDDIVLDKRSRLRLTEKGLAVYSQLINAVIPPTITEQEVLNCFSNGGKLLGVHEISMRLHPKIAHNIIRGRIRTVLDHLRDQKLIFRKMHSSEARFMYALCESIHKDNPIYIPVDGKMKEIGKTSLVKLFFSIVTGTLTAGETTKPYLY